MDLSPGRSDSGILTGVIAFVDVWSSNQTENYSKMFSQQLLNLRAKVSKTFNKQVTHVVFKDGSQSTWDKAVKTKVKLVSVLWVEKCRETSMHVDESVYPAINTNTGLSQFTKKKRKCMQPKDFVEKTPENNRRFARKFDKMCKDLDVQKASVDIPILVFDDDGTILYSPKAVVADRFNAMEKRIQEMKDKREQLSPTASQMSHTFDTSPVKPTPGNSPSIFSNSPHEYGSSSLNTSYEELFQGVVKEDSVPSTPISNKIHIPNEDTINSVASKSGLFTQQKTEEVKSSSERVRRRLQQTKIRKSNLFKLAEGTTDGAARFTMNDPQLDFTAIASNTCEATNVSIQSSLREEEGYRKVEATHSATDCESDAFSNTSTEKERLTGSDYSSMANRLIALCEEKKQCTKTRRCTLKPEALVPCAKNKAVKVEAKLRLSSCTTDSDDAFSNYEDFFTSLGVNNHQSKLNRFSLPMESRKSPSPPPLKLGDKHGHKRRRSLGTALQETSTVKKRKTIRSGTHSDSSPLKYSRKRAASTKKKSPINRPETSVCIKKSDVTENGSPIQMTTVSTVTCMKMQEVPGGKELLHLTACADEGNPMKRFQSSVGSKTSASDAIGGLSGMFNEQRNKCTEDSRKTEKSRKVTRTLVMTSMSAEKQSTIIQVVKKFGGFMFSDEVCETTSHVIAGSPRRTLNIILGIARGCWVLSYDWVLWSLEHGHWIPEEPYELSDHFPGAPICRLHRHLSAGDHYQNLFSSIPAFFISPNSQPPWDKLSQAVQLCGGKVCKALRQAKICIGMFAGKKSPELEIVSEKWLLDCITQHKLLPLHNYLLEHG
ncbi:microcephalin [Anomaloglossus baeobatrachus]|uniref:microcephalin n=1 Tax=Anomaloglossus baeobatrachus TaxID=238106 RepID=UPI003F4FB8D0